MLFAGTIRIGKSDTDSEYWKVICQLVDITAIKGIFKFMFREQDMGESAHGCI